MVQPPICRGWTCATAGRLVLRGLSCIIEEFSHCACGYALEGAYPLCIRVDWGSSSKFSAVRVVATNIT